MGTSDAGLAEFLTGLKDGKPYHGFPEPEGSLKMVWANPPSPSAWGAGWGHGGE